MTYHFAKGGVGVSAQQVHLAYVPYIILYVLSSKFTLDEAGDIKWKLDQTPSDYLPFLTCDSYELTPCPDCKVYISFTNPM
jgi:hypothetical protein